MPSSVSWKSIWLKSPSRSEGSRGDAERYIEIKDWWRPGLTPVKTPSRSGAYTVPQSYQFYLCRTWHDIRCSTRQWWKNGRSNPRRVHRHVYAWLDEVTVNLCRHAYCTQEEYPPRIHAYIAPPLWRIEFTDRISQIRYVIWLHVVD
jgi:hypothetical protein